MQPPTPHGVLPYFLFFFFFPHASQVNCLGLQDTKPLCSAPLRFWCAEALQDAWFAPGAMPEVGGSGATVLPRAWGRWQQQQLSISLKALLGVCLPHALSAYVSATLPSS